MPDPTTESLRLDQIERARQEKAHERRADKASYLREKLAERAKAEDEAAAED